MSEHDWEDDEQECSVVSFDTEAIRYEFRVGDIVGIGFEWVANVLQTTAGASRAIAREFYAATNQRRADAAEAREGSKLSDSDAELLAILQAKDDS